MAGGVNDRFGSNKPSIGKMLFSAINCFLLADTLAPISRSSALAFSFAIYAVFLAGIIQI
jgi:hypothetical protein